MHNDLRHSAALLELLNQVAEWIPAGPRMTLFGDAEFRAVEVQRCCQRRRWHWHLGLKQAIDITQPAGNEVLRPATGQLLPGRRR